MTCGAVFSARAAPVQPKQLEKENRDRMRESSECHQQTGDDPCSLAGAPTFLLCSFLQAEPGKAAKPPCPALLSRDLSLLTLDEMSWLRLSTAAGQPGRQQGGLCQAVRALPAAGQNPSPKRQDNTGFV